LSDARLSRNPLSIIGAAVTTVSAVGFVVYVILDAFGVFAGAYTALIGYLALPALVVFGLLLIPLGIWREGRRRKRGVAAWPWPVIDAGRSRTRWIIVTIALLTVVNIGIVALASVGAVHYTESNEFCGQVCHTPMAPQFTAHAVSPHAKVDCVQCHVSPGAVGFATAKWNGTRQLYLLASGKYARPIPEPLGRIPAALNTCAECHQPGRPGKDITRTIASYADDEANTESVTTLTMKMAANHWHAQADVVVEYAASDDARETIPYIRATRAGGAAVDYFADGVTTRPAGQLVRMDCIDCHNRPAHTFSPAADRSVDLAIAAGEVNRQLPFVRREMVAALKVAYPSHAASDAGIGDHLTAFYKSAPASQSQDVQRAIETARKLYRQNVFPDMNVTWGTYLSKLGHTDSPGCFRCHDDGHKARDGKAIRQDCELCHTIK